MQHFTNMLTHYVKSGWGLALSPHHKKDPGLNPSQTEDHPMRAQADSYNTRKAHLCLGWMDGYIKICWEYGKQLVSQ